MHSVHGTHACILCRCLLLRTLCDLRSERQDARDLMDLGQMTEKTQQKLHAAEHGDAAKPIIYEPVRPPPASHRPCCRAADEVVNAARSVS